MARHDSHDTSDPTSVIEVVAMAYGTPRRPEDIESYYTDIRRGRPPTPEALAELTARYDAIGGLSPLAARTQAQAEQLQRQLDAAAPQRFHVRTGLKHADPQIESAVADAVATNPTGVVGIVWAPHYSAYSVGQYLDRMRTAASDVPTAAVTSWAVEPAFVDFLADDLATRVQAMRDRTGGRVRVLFTAHSLPERILASGDPYPDELRATAVAVSERVGLVEGDDWSIAWQSAGRTPEPWIGPDILAVLDQLAADGVTTGVVVCACGFVADHLEVLYDLDIEAAARATQLGLAFDRTACVNDDEGVVHALAARVVAAADDLKRAAETSQGHHARN